MSARHKHKHALLLLALALGMFGFAFALVPLYDVFCDLTGINGRTAGRSAAVDDVPATATEREVTIQLLAKVARGMPWEFRPTEEQVSLQVGEMHTTTFYVRNHASEPVTGQAVPSVSPGRAALHLKKLECFCFERQVLDGGDEMEMPVTFYVADDLPVEINELSLSYTLFRIEPAEPEQIARNR